MPLMLASLLTRAVDLFCFISTLFIKSTKLRNRGFNWPISVECFGTRILQNYHNVGKSPHVAKQLIGWSVRAHSH